MNKTDCIFCRLSQESVGNSSRIISNSDGFFVMLSLHPQTRGHLLVIPNRHIESLNELTSDEVSSIFSLATLMGEKLITQLEAKAFTLKVNNQLFKLEGVGKGHVGHIHVHVIPRYTPEDDLPEFPEEGEEEDFKQVKQQLLKNS